MVQRIAIKPIKSFISPGKVLVLYGPRRVGKTTLLLKLQKNLENTPLYLNGEERAVKEIFSSHDSGRIKGYIGKSKTIFLDEAQHITDIGENLKLLSDTFKDLSLIVSGSSSFDLAQKTGEPLTGRKEVVILYPFSQMELVQNFGEAQTINRLEESLIFGSYPEVFSLNPYIDKERYLKNLAESYLYRDALMMEEIRRPEKIFDLLRLLAFQIGQEVSLTELGSCLGLSRNTVIRYLNILEKSFVVKNIRGFSQNLRSEVVKNSRYYFWDNGVRNAVISNFNSIASRNDIGMLWENFLVMERLKTQSHLEIISNNYFWRTYERQEIDWVEEREGKLFGYEFKWQKKDMKVPRLWKENYPEASYEVFTRENYLEFLLKK